MSAICCVLVMASAALGGTLTLHAEDSKAVIRCDDSEFDFGRKDSREDVVHAFVLSNKGGGTLKIANIDAPCGCTVVMPSGQQIEPGEKLDLTVTFRLAGRSGPQAKSVFVESNAENRKRFELVMRGTALSRVKMTPSSIYFGRTGRGKRLDEAVEIAVDQDSAFNVMGVKSDSPFAMPSFKAVTPRRLYCLNVALDERCPTGRFDATIDVVTDSKEYPVLHIPVSAEVVGSLVVTPAEIVLKEGANATTISVFVMAGEVAKFKIVDVLCPLPQLCSKVAPFGEDGFRILLSNVAGAVELNGLCLKVTTDVPSMKEIVVPFRVAAHSSGLTARSAQGQRKE
jgi:hypothetical protein